jgi:uncharacterized SAM-binding protein YcdF (DUF218 family)
MTSQRKSRPRRRLAGAVAKGLLLFGAALALYYGVVLYEVWRQSAIDEARPADVIVVMGAAEYWGRPSPVLKARLDHALDLYNRQLAPRIIATGGYGAGSTFSEGEVSRAYLSERGVPAEFISVEKTGVSTMQSAAGVAEMMDRMRLSSCILVSDDYHIHRGKRMLEGHGLTVYGSPRATPQGDRWNRAKRLSREALGYIMWRIGIRV